MERRPSPRRVPPSPASRGRAGAAGRAPMRLILVPAAITLGVTLLRLGGELRHGPPALFSRLPGGGLALVGIAWVAPVFGAWFGYRLGRSGLAPPGKGRALGLPLAAAATFFLVGWVAEKAGWAASANALIAVFAVGAVLALAVSIPAWPALGQLLVAYAVAARIPVAVVMLFAILAGWGTHYDAPPPVFPAMLPLRRWLWTGLLPQATIWVAYTVVVGMLFCGLGPGVA